MCKAEHGAKGPDEIEAGNDDWARVSGCSRAHEGKAKSMMVYRQEIDGLRAVAVVPVIIFHAGVTLFSGGYVGVDVFFVISGYLITSILIGELEEGNFSIARFYERRARRILPALFFVILCCIPFAWMWMLPSELTDFSNSVVAVVFFVSNILFWREEGYFAPSAEQKPLLHTWSLAVEEQYYVLFPIFLLLAWRFGRNRVFWTICIVAALSLIASELGWRYKPSANFYLAPTRAWELLAGSICALWLTGREQSFNNLLSLAGLALIVFAIFAYDDKVPFPSVYALAPVVGTALIIVFGGSGSWTAKLLGMRGFVGIGLISYSAYLWHQPLFAFARIRSILEPSPLLMAAMTVLSLVLACFSWHFIEKPFRKGQGSVLPTRRAAFAASGAGAALLTACGMAGSVAAGFPQRTTPSGDTYEKALKSDQMRPNYGLSSECNVAFTLSMNCRTSPHPQAVLWGDSFAMHLTGALRSSATPLEFIQHTKSQCAPILDIAVIDSVTSWQDCVAFNDKILDYIKNNKELGLVILASAFAISGDTSVIFDRRGRSYKDGNRPLVEQQMIKTVRMLEGMGKQVVIIVPPPTDGIDHGKCLLKSSLRKSDLGFCNFVAEDKNINGNKKIIAFVKQVTGENALNVVVLDHFICKAGMCKASDEGTFVYRDTGHLSVEGSKLIGKKYDISGAIIAAANGRKIG